MVNVDLASLLSQWSLSLLLFIPLSFCLCVSHSVSVCVEYKVVVVVNAMAVDRLVIYVNSAAESVQELPVCLPQALGSEYQRLQIQLHITASQWMIKVPPGL